MLTNRKALAGGVLGVLMAWSAAGACDIPVYKYALLNWPRDPAMFMYFHKDSPDPADAAVNQRLKAITDDAESRLNMVHMAFDVAKPDALPKDSFPAMLLSEKIVKTFPQHVIISSKGTIVFQGRLTTADVDEITASPAAAQIAAVCAKGERGTLVLLLGADKAGAAAAQKALTDGLALAKKEELEANVVTVRMDDPKEKWLVRQFLAVEKDLAEKAKGGESMLFPVVGRANVLEACVGAGITDEIVAQVIGFINGPCSCQVKEGLFGMDLVTNLNWEEAIPRKLFEEERAGEEDQWQSSLAGVGSEPPAQPGEAQAGESKPAAADQPMATTTMLLPVAIGVGIVVVLVVAVGAWMLLRRRGEEA